MNISGLIAILSLSGASALQAADSPKSFVMTTAKPVLVSNTLLTPGKHIFKLMESQSNPHIVQISNAANLRVEAVILAIPKYREVITPTNEIQFWETPSGYARALRSWFRPGESSGQEFPYSTKAVLAAGRVDSLIASVRSKKEPSPRATAKSLPASFKAEHLPVQEPQGSWAVVTDGPPATAKTRQSSARLNPRESIWDKLKHLPLTATIAPLIGLIGVGFLLFFVGSKRRNLIPGQR